MVSGLGDPAAWRRTLACLLVGIAAGAVCAALHTPIPWMLGPLFGTAAVRLAGHDVAVPVAARYIGQWIIGTALGLYFTPPVIRLVGELWYLPLAGAAGAILIGYASGAVLAVVGRLDLTTSVFASVPGGAAEMSTLGERFGARVDRVAAAQSMRILLVVAIVPAAFTLTGQRGGDIYTLATTSFDAQGFAILMASTLAAGYVAQLMGVPNGFVLGSLAVAIPLTALAEPLSSMPTVVSNAAQLLLGCALGSRFERDFLRGAPRFVAAVVVSVLASIALAFIIGIALARVAGQNPSTIVLGMAPGGIAEMTITAKVLQLGVPLVTTFHVTRLVVVLLVTGPLFARVRAWRRARRS